ncbi:MAG TPA: metallophosphoesterase family protein [Usitatibacter sp.]|nr:metallophosphoesterase family protein [Usitatibacter sp.]
MAVYGVLGDIHGNREALEAALARLDAHGVERIVCVGDLVGYNADPDACVELLRSRGVVSIAGNHDLIGTGKLGFERCSNKAMHSLKRTRRALAPATARYLRQLPSHLVLEDRVLLTHGGVRDVQQYMTKPKHIVENLGYLREDFPGVRLCFFGHTHEQKIFAVREAVVSEPYAEAIANGGEVALAPDADYFINPGSVDASRKRGDKRAELAIFDSSASRLRFESVSYDDAETEERAAAGGYRIDRWRDRLYDVQRRLIGPRHQDHA